MLVRIATEKDTSFLVEHDSHISYDVLIESIQLKRIFVLEKDGLLLGWLRFNLFWDNTPFMNLLYIIEPYRKKGYGALLVQHFESQMLKRGYRVVMTSTLVHEAAIHFYLKQKYKVVGGFHPNVEEYEVLLQKNLEIEV